VPHNRPTLEEYAPGIEVDSGLPNDVRLPPGRSAPRAADVAPAPAAAPDSIKRDSSIVGIDTTWRYTVREYRTRVDTVHVSGGGTPSSVVGAWGPSAFITSTSITDPGGVLGSFTYAPNENANRAEWLLEDVAEAKLRGLPVQLALPCGAHSGEKNSAGVMTKLGNCLIDSSGVAVFSRRRFDSAATAILTAPGVRDSLQSLRARGLLSGLQIMDEPWVSGGDDGAGLIVGNTWGPPGTITRARADSLCGFVKNLAGPGIPVGLSDHLAWDKGKTLKVCDYTAPQFSNRFGDLTRWRDTTLALAKKAGHQTHFSFNILNGGTQDADMAARPRPPGAKWDCRNEGGRLGSRPPNCRMTPAQVTAAVTVLGAYTCSGLMMWRYDAAKLGESAYLEVFKQGIALQKSRTLEQCRVRGAP